MKCDRWKYVNDTCYLFVDVKNMLTAIFEMGVSSVVLKIDEVGPPDATDALYERSHYTFFDKQGKIFDKGKWATMYTFARKTLWEY